MPDTEEYGKQFFMIAAAGALSAFIVQYATRSWPQKTATMALSQLINAASVSDIADELDTGTPDDFILNSWNYVGSDITYSYYGSILHFRGAIVHCQKCLLPSQVISIGEANCVGKSVLLTSILRNRIPSNSIYTVIGKYHKSLSRKVSLYVPTSSVPMPYALMPYASTEDSPDYARLDYARRAGGFGSRAEPREPSIRMAPYASAEEDYGHAWVQVQREDGNWYLLEATSPPSSDQPWVQTDILSDLYTPDAWINDVEIRCFSAELCALGVDR